MNTLGIRNVPIKKNPNAGPPKSSLLSTLLGTNIKPIPLSLISSTTKDIYAKRNLEKSSSNVTADIQSVKMPKPYVYKRASATTPQDTKTKTTAPVPSSSSIWNNIFNASMITLPVIRLVAEVLYMYRAIPGPMNKITIPEPPPPPPPIFITVEQPASFFTTIAKLYFLYRVGYYLIGYRGLSPSVRRSIRTPNNIRAWLETVSTPIGRPIADRMDAQLVCSVCLDNFEHTDVVTRPCFLTCGHKFHTSCIVNCWAEPRDVVVTLCPNCRSSQVLSEVTF